LKTLQHVKINIKIVSAVRKRIKDRRLNVMEYRLDNPVWQFSDRRLTKVTAEIIEGHRQCIEIDRQITPNTVHQEAL